MSRMSAADVTLSCANRNGRGCWASIVRVLTVCLAATIPTPALAQQAQAARVEVSVADQTGGIIPGAIVTLAILDPATQVPAVSPATSSDRGVALFERVAPGRYSITVEFPGFEPGRLSDVRIRAGGNRYAVVLALPKVEQSVTVGRNAQTVAADRRGAGFGNTVTDAEINALSDDPAELQRQLQELAGPDAVIRIDSFEGQQLPPKAQIKSIHVVRDQFAAEAANPGSTFVDIVTQPGIGPIRGGLNFTFRDEALMSRNPFVTTKGPEQIRTFGGNIGGALVQGKTSFSVNANGQSQYITPILNVATSGGTRRETLGVRQPQESISVNGLLDHALTINQTLRVSTSTNRIALNNLGIGNFDLPERAWGGRQLIGNLRIQEAGPLGRRAFINTRLAYSQIELDIRPVTEAPTLIVLDAFNAGGAQQRTDSTTRLVTLASDIDYVRGIHSWRVGSQLDVNWTRASQANNYLGTYTFSSREAYEAGAPALYSRISGEPEVSYFNAMAGLYAQDDLRLRGLTISPGVRYSIQSVVSDRTAFEPRIGFTWAARANGRTTLRASAGVFHSFLAQFIYEQVLRIDGERQREVLIRNPSYPDAGSAGVLTPTSKYLMGDFALQRNVRYSAGLDQVLSPLVRVNVLYNWIHFQQQPRGENLNPLIGGVRSDPGFTNVIAVVTDSETRRHEVSVNGTIALAPPGPDVQRARVNWRRVNIQAGYTFVGVQSNVNGPFVPPPTGTLDDEWGPGPADSPYRFNVVATGTQVRNLTTVLTFVANAGQPYTETTGFDDNEDGIINDRRPGVGLRSLRGSGQFNMNMRVSYAFALGGVQAGSPGPQPRYRLNLFANVTNLTNHRNYGGYSGVITSPFYRQATFAQSPRRVDVGMNLTF
jgi:hypothetical protein